MTEPSMYPICEMEFTEIQSGKIVTVRLWRPIQEGSDKRWYCLNEIAGIKGGDRKKTYGGDPFQAIILSIDRFRTTFECLSEKYTESSGQNPQMVFPQFIPIGYGMEIYSKLKSMVAKEAQEMVKDEIRRREKGTEK